jgi:hypothetical protein
MNHCRIGAIRCDPEIRIHSFASKHPEDAAFQIGEPIRNPEIEEELVA